MCLIGTGRVKDKEMVNERRKPARNLMHESDKHTATFDTNRMGKK